MSSSACTLVVGRASWGPSTPQHVQGQATRGFRQGRTPGSGNACIASPFGRDTDCLCVLSVNVLTSGWLKLLHQTHLTGMIWHFLFYLISGDIKAPSFVCEVAG